MHPHERLLNMAVEELEYAVANCPDEDRPYWDKLLRIVQDGMWEATDAIERLSLFGTRNPSYEDDYVGVWDDDDEVESETA